MIAVYLHETDSTNLRARQLLADGAHRAIVSALTQTNGYGRHGHPWISARGGLWLTCGKKEYNQPLSPLLALAASYATMQTLQTFMSAPLGLKWPNDIMISGAKLGGVVVESTTLGCQSSLIIGIGINCTAQPDRQLTGQRVTSLHKWTAAVPSLDELANLIAHAVFDSQDHAAARPDQLLSSVTPVMHTLGKQVVLTSSSGTISGMAEALAPDGALLIRNQNGQQWVVYDGHLRYGIINR